MKKIFLLTTVFCFLISAVSQAAETYQSVYQLPLKISYVTPDGLSHLATYTGFKDQWNPNDPVRRCQQPPGTTCPDDNSSSIKYGLNLASGNGQSVTSDLFRYYIPKGTQYVDLILYGPPTYGQCATIARFGSPPTAAFPPTYDLFSNPAAYPNYFPTVQYPNGKRDLWNGKSIAQLTQYDWFAINEGGHIKVVYSNSPALETGDWLYIKFKRYDTSQIVVHSYIWGADETIYTAWYNSYNSYDAVGDPPISTVPQKPGTPVATPLVNGLLNAAGETEWLSSPQTVNVSCSGADNIYYTVTKTETGVIPPDPGLPSATAYDGVIPGSSGQINLTSVAGAFSTRYKYRFVGVNTVGQGVESGVLKYAIDLTAQKPGVPIPNKASGTTVTSSPLAVTVTSSKATKIYYEMTENGAEPVAPTAASPSITGPSGVITLNGLANQKKTIRIAFCGWNPNGGGMGDPSATFTYTIDLSPLPPGNVNVSPGSGSYATAKYLSISSSNATKIYVELTKTTDGTEPVDPVEPNTNSIVAINGASGTYPLPSQSGLKTWTKVRFRGYNATQLGTSTGVFSYIIELNNLPEQPVASPANGTTFITSPEKITVSCNNADSIYYGTSKSENGVDPVDPAPPLDNLFGLAPSVKNGQIEIKGTTGLKTIYKVIFQGANASGNIGPTSIYKYIIDLTGSAMKPDPVTLTPPGETWTTVPQQITAASAKATSIEYVYTAAVGENSPPPVSDPNPAGPLDGETKGSVSGPAGVIEFYESTAPTSANAIQVKPLQKNTIRLKFAGNNSSGYGTPVEAVYSVDLSPKAGEIISQDQARNNPNVDVTGLIRTNTGLADPSLKILSPSNATGNLQTETGTLYSVIDLITLYLKPGIPNLTIQTRLFESGNVMIIGDPGWQGRIFPFVVDKLVTSNDENKASFSNAGNLDITINNVRISLSPAGAYENQFSEWLKDNGFSIVYGDGHVGKISLDGSDLHLVVRHQLGAVAPENPADGISCVLNPNEDGSIQIIYGDNTIQNLIPYVYDPDAFIASLRSAGNDAFLDCSNGSVLIPDARNPQWVGCPDYELDSSKVSEAPIAYYNGTDLSFTYSVPAGSQNIYYAPVYFKH